MKANLIRIPKSKQPKASGSAASESAEDTRDEIFVGMDVEARFRGKDDWCRATVMKEHQGKGGTTYDLKYADGKSVSEPVCRSCLAQSKLMPFSVYVFETKRLYSQTNVLCAFNMHFRKRK